MLRELGAFLDPSFRAGGKLVSVTDQVQNPHEIVGTYVIRCPGSAAIMSFNWVTRSTGSAGGRGVPSGEKLMFS